MPVSASETSGSVPSQSRVLQAIGSLFATDAAVGGAPATVVPAGGGKGAGGASRPDAALRQDPQPHQAQQGQASASGPTRQQWRQGVYHAADSKLKADLMAQSTALTKFVTTPLAPQPARRAEDPILFHLRPFATDEVVAAVFIDGQPWLPFDSLVSTILFLVFSYNGLLLIDDAFRARLAALLATKMPPEALRTIVYGFEIEQVWQSLVEKRVFPARRTVPVVMYKWASVPLAPLCTELFRAGGLFAFPTHPPGFGQAGAQPGLAPQLGVVTGLATPPLDASPVTPSTKVASETHQRMPLIGGSAERASGSHRERLVRPARRLVVCTGCVERYIDTIANLSTSGEVPTDYGCVYPPQVSRQDAARGEGPDRAGAHPSAPQSGEQRRSSGSRRGHDQASTSARISPADLNHALRLPTLNTSARRHATLLGQGAPPPPALPPLPAHSTISSGLGPPRGQAAMGPPALPGAPSGSRAFSGSRTTSSHAERPDRAPPYPKAPPLNANFETTGRRPSYRMGASIQSTQGRVASGQQSTSSVHRPVASTQRETWTGIVHPCCGGFSYLPLCTENPEVKQQAKTTLSLQQQQPGANSSRIPTREAREQTPYEVGVPATPAPILQTPEEEERNTLDFEFNEWVRKIGEPPGYVFTSDVQSGESNEAYGSSSALIPLAASPSRVLEIIRMSRCPEMADDADVKTKLVPLLEREARVRNEPGWTV